jgi:hypothetical protein
MKTKFSWKRVLNIIFAVILIAGIGLGVFEFVILRQVRVEWASIILDRHEHYIPCAELPFLQEAKKKINNNQDTVEKVKKAGAVEVYPEEIKCPSADGSYFFIKGDVLVKYHTHAQRVAIEKIIGKTFFGIPYRGEKVK